MKPMTNLEKGTSDEEAFSTRTERIKVLDLKVVFHNETLIMNVWNRPFKSRIYRGNPS